MTSRMIIVHGRANGPTFWTWLLGLYAIEAVCNFTIHGPFPLSQFLYPLICVPRLHDVGRSGWWAFGAAVLGIALGTLASVYLSPMNARHVRGAIVLVELILLVILGVSSGQPGANKFGDPPSKGVANLFARRLASESEAKIADTM